MNGGRPIRVSFLIDSLSYAGTEMQLLALIRSLDQSRVLPSLVLLNGTSAESRSLEPSDCPLLRLSLTSFRNLPATARAVTRLARFWKRQHVDVVQTYFLDSTYFGVPLARALGIRRVVRVRNNLGHWLTPTHRGLGRFIGRIVDATITNSQAGHDALRAAEGLPAEKLVVLENGVDVDRFAKLDLPRRENGVTVGVMANLRPVKGVDVLLRAASRMLSWRAGRVSDRRNLQAQAPVAYAPGSPIRFLIAGDGEQRIYLERLAQELQIADHVQFLGRIRNVTSFLSQIDLGVVPSHAEGMSNALLEFMAAGRPVIATEVGANAQLLGHGSRGMLVQPGDEVALADAIHQMVVDEALAARLAAAAQEYVQTYFDRKEMRYRFEDFYARLCA